MTDFVKERCGLFFSNRNAVNDAFRLSPEVNACCALLFSVRHQGVAASTLIDSRNLLRRHGRTYSSFRTDGECLLAANLCAIGMTKQLMEQSLKLYELLCNEFTGTSFLACATMSIAQHVEEDRYAAIAERTHVLYQRIRKQHPILTRGVDIAMYVLLALREESDDELISQIEHCYIKLHHSFPEESNVQPLSFVLTLTASDTDKQCDRVITLFNAFRSAGHKWGATHELPILGILAMNTQDDKDIVQVTIYVDDCLKAQKGFGFLSTISHTQRLMYAALIAHDTSIIAEASTVATSTAQAVAVASIITASGFVIASYD